MATEYKITYTYTGQSNTSKAREVSLSRFKKTGDVDHHIGQIKSIVYEHWHSSTNAWDWSLRGRLVLANDDTFVSDVVTHRISGNIVKYVNTFTTLPTPEQFAQVEKIQTLDPKDDIGDSGYYAKLYWRALYSEPMRIIVTFVEEPPVYYDPKIETFDVVRRNESYEADDEGTKATVSLKVALGNASGANIASLRIYYAPDAYPVVGVSDYVDLTSRIPELLTGVTDDRNILPGDWSTGATWYYAVVFVAGDESAEDVDDMPRALSNLHISGKPNGGVCVCGYSQGTTDKPMFESYAEGFFYAGIHGVTNYVPGEVKTGGKWIDGKEIYRYVMVAQSALDGNAGVIGQMPSAIGDLVSASGTMKGADGSVRPIPYAYYGNNTYNVCFYVDANGAINFQIGSGYSGTNTIILVLEYTKA